MAFETTSKKCALSNLFFVKYFLKRIMLLGIRRKANRWYPVLELQLEKILVV
jgi:hypothetical protein